MPIHDWTRVDAGIFHDFHHAWIFRIKESLNRGLLPPDHYALAEQIAGGWGPDVLTLQHPRPGNGAAPQQDLSGGVALANQPPRVQYHVRSEIDLYAAKAKAVTIRHTSNHRVVAIIEIVSPGNKNSRQGVRAFVEKAVELLRRGIHLLILDLFPPGPRDPQGIHPLIWDAFADSVFVLPPAQPLTLAAYCADQFPEAYVEPTAVGKLLIEMPVFLAPDIYVPLPLEAAYQSAWESVPTFWRTALTTPEDK